MSTFNKICNIVLYMISHYSTTIMGILKSEVLFRINHLLPNYHQNNNEKANSISSIKIVFQTELHVDDIYRYMFTGNQVETWTDMVITTRL